MDNCYLVSRGEIRNGTKLIYIRDLSSREDFLFLVDVYAKVTNCRAEHYSRAMEKYEEWAMSVAKIRTIYNLCAPPTDEQLVEFDNSLIKKEPGYGSYRHPDAYMWIEYVKKFWKWVRFETFRDDHSNINLKQ